MTSPAMLTLAVLGIGIASMLSGCDSSNAPSQTAVPNRPPVLSAFAGFPTSGRGADFHWTVTDPDGDSLTCSLDANGDGTTDATIQDCRSTSSDSETYPSLGPYMATLEVDDGHGHTATASTEVIAAGTSTTVPLWTDQVGSYKADKGTAMAMDGAEHVAVAGVTQGPLFGSFQGGSSDAFVALYDAAGQLQWGRQLGTANDDLANGVALDGNGDVLVTGYRADGGGNTTDDAFIARYDPTGSLLWDRMLGATGGDRANAVATDSQGAIILAGITLGDVGGPNQGGYDPFVMKLSGDGNQILWARQPGTSQSDSANAVAVDGNDDIVFAGGDTLVGFGGTGGAVTAEYDKAGKQLWLRRLGQGQDVVANAVAVDAAGDVAIAGATTGALQGTNQGSADAFLAEYDATGQLRWVRQFGTANDDELFGVGFDGAGDVIVSGWRYGLVWNNSYGWIATTAKYDAAGTQVWLREIHQGAASTQALATAIDGQGDVLLTGEVSGNLASVSYGGTDLLLLSYPP